MMDKNMTAFCGTYCGVCEWKAGNYVYEKLGNSAQEKAKNMNAEV